MRRAAHSTQLQSEARIHALLEGSAGALNVAERTQVEQELRLLVTALEAAANTVIITDAQGVITWVNPSFTRLTGYTAEEALGQNPRLLKSGQHGPEFYRQLWQTILAGEVWQGEVINRRKDGTLYTEEMTITPVRDAAGQIASFIAIKQDISARKAVEQMKSEFVSLVSHELRTPLTAIKGYVDMMLDGDAGELSTEQTEYLTTVQSNATRLVEMINNLLDVSRIESGRIELRRAQVDIAPLVAQSIALLRPQIEAKRQKLTLHLPADLPQIDADADRLVQILINLLSNATKYTPDGGQIALRVETDGERLRISIADNGIGISAEAQRNLFSRFYRAPDAATQRVRGAGLGLWITKSLVEMHSGEIIVQSAPGQGSIFTVTLPLCPALI